MTIHSDYRDINVFNKQIWFPFVSANKENKIHIWVSKKDEGLDCSDCNNKWIKSYHEHFEMIGFYPGDLRCRTGMKVSDVGTFAHCADLITDQDTSLSTSQSKIPISIIGLHLFMLLII